MWYFRSILWAAFCRRNASPGGAVKIYAQIYLQAPLLKLSRYLEEDADFYRPLVRVNGSELFMEKLKKVFTDHMLHDSDIPDDMRHSKMVSPHICYFAGGIVNLYKQWFRGDLDCTLDDIAMEVSKLLRKYIISRGTRCDRQSRSSVRKRGLRDRAVFYKNFSWC